jgi:hypothetical protein
MVAATAITASLAGGAIAITALPAAALTAHQAHVLHLAHLRALAEARPAVRTAAVSPAYQVTYSFAGLEGLWAGAGGPAWAEYRAARIAECESGGYTYAHNPSGASGLWQILGLPFAGDPYNPYTNALMAVAKFRAAGDTFRPWVCQ